MCGFVCTVALVYCFPDKTHAQQIPAIFCEVLACVNNTYSMTTVLVSCNIAKLLVKSLMQCSGKHKRML